MNNSHKSPAVGVARWFFLTLLMEIFEMSIDLSYCFTLMEGEILKLTLFHGIWNFSLYELVSMTTERLK